MIDDLAALPAWIQFALLLSIIVFALVLVLPYLKRLGK